MPIVKLSERGQMVIPQEIREKLELHKGSRLHVDFSAADKTIVLRPLVKNAPLNLRGFLKDGDPLRIRAQERRKELEKDDRRLRS